ncbi:MAG: cytidylate kinase-like family protein [Ruminococcus sp.]|nr:cytidylate kinase-like family protein [Ruminococcus sp.]
MSQMIISIGREYGSGGHEIAQKLSEKLGIAMYDRNMLESIAEYKGVDYSELQKYDEAPRNKLMTRTIKGMSSSHEDNIAHMQFDYLKDKAENGESFVVVGRCAETVLKDYEGLVSFFVLGDKESRIQRIARVRNMSYDEAKSAVSRHDRSRKFYHNRYSDVKWGDSRNYDITINSSKIGVNEVVNILLDYIDKRFNK